jgi:hypothetical protein
MKIKVISSLFIGIVLVFGACSTKGELPADNSGFFEDYDDLKEQISENKNIDKYRKIMIKPVVLITRVPLDEQTPEQKILYDKIQRYVDSKYKNMFPNGSKYVLVKHISKDVLVLQSAISIVEVHPEDKEWNQYTPLMMKLDVSSYVAYVEGDARVLNEIRMYDLETKEVLYREIKIQNDTKIIVDGDDLDFSSIKPALDRSIEELKKELNK